MHRVNILLDDTAWAALQEVPSGERSKLVNKAILSIAEAKIRTKAANKMDMLRNKIPKSISTTKAAKLIREDRKR